jgi:FAD/FMN-containing dehydrogenase
MRRHGLTVDNLRAVDLVTAEGERLRVDAEREPELFWGVRGAKHSFGIVTSMTFGLVPVARLAGGALLFDAAVAEPVLRAWAAWDVRFGILKRRPDVAAAFDPSVAAGRR